MSELKTRPTAASVSEFLAQQGDQRRADCEAVLRMMEAATGERALEDAGDRHRRADADIHRLRAVHLRQHRASLSD